jgi:hypothetical protein
MNYPFDTVGLDGNTIDILDETHKLLKSKFDIHFTGDIDFHLEDFQVFRECSSVNLKGSYVIKNAPTDCYFLIVEPHTIKKSGRGNSIPGLHDCSECQTWALAYLKKDFGRVFIRPETIADKLVELIHPIELDFEEDKAFSDTFYVLVTDRWKADAAMDRDFRNVVMDVRHEDVVIEIIDHTLIIGYGRPVSPDAAMNLANFVVRLCSNC